VRARSGDGAYARIYAVVRRIPRGRVATYGQVAALAGLPGHARQVGYALSALGSRDERVPWQRVVNARGEVSPRGEPGWDEIQRSLLEDEGIDVDARGRIDLRRWGWRPRARRS
jgi:methylated-DNA-protein-cysteine methyltransferase related protein